VSILKYKPSKRQVHETRFCHNMHIYIYALVGNNSLTLIHNIFICGAIVLAVKKWELSPFKKNLISHSLLKIQRKLKTYRKSHIN